MANDGNGNGGNGSWGAVPGMWGVKLPEEAGGASLGMDWVSVARQLSREEPGALIDTLTEDAHGHFIFNAAIVLKEKQFKWLKKKVMSGPVAIETYFDALAHPETGVVIVYVLVEIAGFKTTFRGFVDVSDLNAHGMLSGLENAAENGIVDLMFVSPRGRYFFLHEQQEPAGNRMEEVLLGAIDEFRESAWSKDDFLDAFADIDGSLTHLGIRTIADHREARQQAEAEFDEENGYDA